MVASREPHERTALVEVHAIHQAAHQEDAEATGPLIEQIELKLLVIFKAFTVIADFDGQLLIEKCASHGEAALLGVSAVLHGVCDRLARRQANIIDFLI